MDMCMCMHMHMHMDMLCMFHTHTEMLCVAPRTDPGKNMGCGAFGRESACSITLSGCKK